MFSVITIPNEKETSLVDALYIALRKKSYYFTKREIEKIPSISTFERINFYLFRKYAVTLLREIESFETKTSDELKEMCRGIIR